MQAAGACQNHRLTQFQKKVLANASNVLTGSIPAMKLDPFLALWAPGKHMHFPIYLSGSTIQ
jgi:hypothetical protein